MKVTKAKLAMLAGVILFATSSMCESYTVGGYTYNYEVLYNNGLPSGVNIKPRQAVSPNPTGDFVIPNHLPYDSTNFLPVVNIGYYKGKGEPDGHAFYSSTMTSVVIPDTVTNIDVTAFADCTSLVSVKLPASLKTIGWGAFADCPKLSEIILPTGLVSVAQHAFVGCVSLESVSFPEGTKCIADRVFTSKDSFLSPRTTYSCDPCTNLTSVVIPSSVTNIGYGAFSECTGLRTAVVGGGAICGSAFAGCTALSDVSLGENVTSIGESAFYGCANLTEIVIPDSVTTIDNYAFCGCTKLTRIGLGSGVRNIGNYAFQGCTNLTEIVIPSGVTTIGVRAFQDCKSLTAIVIPSSVKTIGERAFYGCESLVSVKGAKGLDMLGQYAFLGDASLEEVEIGSGIIGQSAFSNCHKLNSVNLGNGVTQIGRGAFYGCKALISIALPNSITEIGYEAFRESVLEQIQLSSSITNIATLAFCRTNLKDLVIPGSVKTVGSSAFSGCASLTNVVVCEGVERLSSGTFASCSSLKEVILPSSIRELSNAFERLGQLERVEIPYGITNISNSAFNQSGLRQIVIPDSVVSIGKQAFYYCYYTTNIVLGQSVESIGSEAFYGVGASISMDAVVVTAYGSLPSDAGNLPRTKKYVVTEEHLASWLPWLVQNKIAYAILDEETQQEVRVVVEGDAVEAVGIAASLGLSPARTTDAEGAVVTYAVPTLSIESFDPAAGRVDVLVTPAEGGAVTGDLVTDRVSVEWSDNIADWTPLSGIHVDAMSYRMEGTKGRFTCTFDASGHNFYKVKVSAQ